MENSFLLDMLGVLIGFTGIMLVLSLLVTVATQYLNALFNMRALCLRKGLSGLVASALDGTAVNALKEGSLEKLPKVIGVENANREPISIARRISSQILKVDRELRGSWWRNASWITRPELDALIGRLEPEVAKLIDTTALNRAFERMEASSSQHFQAWTNAFTVLSASLVAFIFQVSAFELLQRLSEDDEFRTRAQASAIERLQETPEASENPSLFAVAQTAAMKALKEAFPDQNFASLPASLETYTDARAALAGLLSGVAQADELQKRYDDEIFNAVNTETQRRVDKEVGALASLNIQPWGSGLEFYRASEGVSWSRFLGVVATAALISLGAPFWYNRLRELASLRDMLSPPKDGKPAGSAT